MTHRQRNRRTTRDCVSTLPEECPRCLLAGDGVRQRIPGAERLELPGGHASHLQNADAFLAAFRRRLDNVSA